MTSLEKLKAELEEIQRDPMRSNAPPMVIFEQLKRVAALIIKIVETTLSERMGVDQLETAAISREEGADWIPFKAHHQSGRVHAIRFANGLIWDAYNGWREPNPLRKPIVRVPMGRADV